MLSNVKNILICILYFLISPLTILFDSFNPKYNAPISRRVKSAIGGIGAYILTIIILPFLIIFLLIKRKPISKRIWVNNELKFKNISDACDILERVVKEKNKEELKEEWWYFVDDFAGILHLDNDLFEMGKEFAEIMQNYPDGETPFENQGYANEIEQLVIKWRKLIN